MQVAEEGGMRGGMGDGAAESGQYFRGTAPPTNGHANGQTNGYVSHTANGYPKPAEPAPLTSRNF